MSYSYHANWPISRRAFYIEIYTILIQGSILNSARELYSLQSDNTSNLRIPLNAFNPVDMSSSAITIYRFSFPFTYLSILSSSITFILFDSAWIFDSFYYLYFQFLHLRSYLWFILSISVSISVSISISNL